MKAKFLLAFFATPFFLFAQDEANNWYFGYGAGVDFSSGSPVALSNGQIFTDEGCSSMSDASGNLLFYTDGSSIWNVNHVTMPNGTGLTGNSSSTQSGLIVKQPGNPNLYYVFTTMANMDYSVVDISLNGGLGDVVAGSKNIFVCAGSEKMCAVKHTNGSDVWIISHESGTNGINAFLLTPAGLNPVGVHSNTGLPDLSLYGQMKIAPTGQWLAMGINSGPETVSICEFDRSTGVCSNGFGLATPNTTQTYGLEFSPNGNRLYTTGESGLNNVYQFDMTAGSPAAIAASATLIGVTTGAIPAGMQLGPDLKIYLSRQSGPYIDCIEDPDVLGIGCNYVTDAVFLNGFTSGIGLPGFEAGLFANQPPIALFTAVHHLCPGTCTSFNNNSLWGGTYQWYFPGAIPSSSTDTAPQNICYYTPGNYPVTLIATNANGTDSLTLPNYMVVYPFSPPQSVIQSGDTLIAGAGFVSYQWFYNGDTIPGATNTWYMAPQSGDYSMICIDDNGCIVETVILNVIAKVNDAGSAEMFPVVYPNPAGDEISIAFPSNWNSTRPEFSIFDMLGRELSSFERNLDNPESDSSHSLSLDVHSLASGTYLVEINTGQRLFHVPFVKR